MSRSLGVLLMGAGLLIAFLFFPFLQAPPETKPNIFIVTVDQSGTQISASIFVDNQFVGKGKVGMKADLTEHTASFGELQGYVKPADISFKWNGSKLLCWGVGFANGDVGCSVDTIRATYKTITPPSQITGSVTIETVDESGNRINGIIYVDSQQKGIGFWSGSLSIGVHTVAYGPIFGYQLPPAHNITVYANQPLNIRTVYYKATSSTPTTTLTVSVKACSIRLKTCWAEQNANVEVFFAGTSQSAAPLTTTDKNGIATFTVAQNKDYDVKVHSSYGDDQQRVSVGTSPAQVTFTFYTSGLSIIGITIFGSSSFALPIFIFGIMLSLLGFVLIMRGGGRG
jgi:hypothetical protein